LHEPTTGYALDDPIDPQFATWIDRGIVLPPTAPESERVLIRAEGQGLIKGGDAQRLRGMLHRAQASWTRMSVSADVLTPAGVNRSQGTPRPIRWTAGRRSPGLPPFVLCPGLHAFGGFS
jgi:hypothetical protein